MSYDKYPLHPGQTHMEPQFMQIPVEEYESLKKRIEELQDKVQQKDFFWEGCGLSKRGFKNTIQVCEYIEELEEERRWRNVSEELPPDGASVLATDGDEVWLCYKTTMSDGEPWFQPDGLPHIEGVTHWKPKPKAPEKR